MFSEAVPNEELRRALAGAYGAEYTGAHLELTDSMMSRECANAASASLGGVRVVICCNDFSLAAMRDFLRLIVYFIRAMDSGPELNSHNHVNAFAGMIGNMRQVPFSVTYSTGVGTISTTTVSMDDRFTKVCKVIVGKRHTFTLIGDEPEPGVLFPSDQ